MFMLRYVVEEHSDCEHCESHLEPHMQLRRMYFCTVLNILNPSLCSFSQAYSIGLLKRNSTSKCALCVSHDLGRQRRLALTDCWITFDYMPILRLTLQYQHDVKSIRCR